MHRQTWLKRGEILRIARRCKAVIDVWRKCQADVKEAEEKEEAERIAAGGGSEKVAAATATGGAGSEADLYNK